MGFGFGWHQGCLGCHKSEEMDLVLQRNWSVSSAIDVYHDSVVIMIDAFKRKGRTLHEGIDLGELVATY